MAIDSAFFSITGSAGFGCTLLLFEFTMRVVAAALEEKRGLPLEQTLAQQFSAVSIVDGAAPPEILRCYILTTKSNLSKM